MPDSWEDLVAPVRRVANAMVDYLPGYATERDKFQRRVREGGPNRQDVGEAIFNAMSAIGVRNPGPYGWAARMEAIPQRDAAVTGGGSRYDPSLARNNSMELGNRRGVETAGDIRTRYAEPPRRELRTTANDNSDRPFAVQTKGSPEPASNAVTPDRTIALLEELGARVTQVKDVKGTVYIKFEDPVNPRLSFQAQPTIRIPADQHAGRPMKPGEAGVLFDTASRPGRQPVNPLTAMDETGRPYADFGVLESTLRRRFQPSPEAPPRTAEGADFSPDQPRLLAVGVPAVAGIPIWQNVPELAARESDAQSNVGRFAAPIASPDAQLAANTRSLSDRVSVATRNIEADFDFSDLVTPVTPHARAGMRQAFNAMAGS